MEEEIRNRGLWSKYADAVAAQYEAGEGETLAEVMVFADCESRCLAALVAVGSKYIVAVEPQGA
jgi:hypothetical protein